MFELLLKICLSTGPCIEVVDNSDIYKTIDLCRMRAQVIHYELNWESPADVNVRVDFMCKKVVTA